MRRRTIALVAHDERKAALVAWVERHRAAFADHKLFATGTTGTRVLERCPELDLEKLKSGPLGGDQQIGAMIAEGRVDALIFFIDAMTPLPHDVDVKALTRLSTVYDIPMALNEATAELLITNPAFAG